MIKPIWHDHYGRRIVTGAWLCALALTLFVSQNPAEAHFGMGAVQSVDISVFWPDGSQSSLVGVAADQILTISKP